MSVTITANLKSLTNAADVGSAVFTLVGFGADVPRVSGSIISVLSVTAVADNSGNISQAVIRNDTITPAGTHYTVTFLSDLGGFISSAKYRFATGGPIDLSTVAPL